MTDKEFKELEEKYGDLTEESLIMSLLDTVDGFGSEDTEEYQREADYLAEKKRRNGDKDTLIKELKAELSQLSRITSDFRSMADDWVDNQRNMANDDDEEEYANQLANEFDEIQQRWDKLSERNKEVLNND